MRSVYNRRLFERRLQKNFQSCRIVKNLDVLIYLDYVLFIKRLAQVSSDSALQQQDMVDKRGLIPITDKHIKENMEQVLREFRG
ncbi:hypothetical protein BCR42DRAFT_408051 [Absidia repens]|uniref:Uncharacterized protein n=1 Tax=Absidia repens TaxID=90262 RepID=A0A1X2IT31_9FUNG|nr:hypothetical protein BCR42DRAFT_408051 [Absidia repens]